MAYAQGFQEEDHTTNTLAHDLQRMQTIKQYDNSSNGTPLPDVGFICPQAFIAYGTQLVTTSLEKYSIIVVHTDLCLVPVKNGSKIGAGFNAHCSMATV